MSVLRRQPEGLVWKSGASSPIGGMFCDRAQAEYENARHLVDHNVPSIVPVLWGKYERLRLQDHGLGFVCSAVDDDYGYNLESIAEYPLYSCPEVARYFSGVAQCLNVRGQGIRDVRSTDLLSCGRFTDRLEPSCETSVRQGYIAILAESTISSSRASRAA